MSTAWRKLRCSLLKSCCANKPAVTPDNISPEVLRDEKSLAREIRRLEKLMLDHARNLEFEQAAAARDSLNRLKDQALFGPAHP